MQEMEQITEAPINRPWKRRVILGLASVAVLAICLAVRAVWGPGEAVAQAAEETKPAAVKPVEKTQVVAEVNGQQVSRNDLAKECLRHYGSEVLESLVNKHLIDQHCKLRNVTVTTAEVDAEIERNAQRFAIPKDQWLKMLESERNITPQQYAKDIIWPTVALRKLAAARLEVSDADVQAAYETQFGPSVQARLIAVSDRALATEVREMAVKKPADFGVLARKYSEDTNSASANGLIQPIRKHMGDPNIEQVAFGLPEGEISEIIAVGEQFVILKCERQMPGSDVPMANVRPTLEEAIRDKKLRLVANDVFSELQKESTVVNVLNDPAELKKRPGVAALINNKAVTIRELAEECIERHGIEVLQGIIDRRLLEQACKQRKIEITREEMDAEIARAAESMGKTTPDGQVDVAAWLKEVTQEQGMTVELYEYDSVWPSVALKRLAGDKVKISQEDLQKGFEANFGKRVICRAIVCNQLRKAQEAWDLARRKPTFDNFGEVAEQYSVDATSRALKGEIPEIQQHGGRPQLEKAAFELHPGELSGIIQVEDTYVILMCEGFTKPVVTELSEVKDQIYKDLHEKKLRISMAQEFTKLHDNANIDNYLAETTHTPKKKKKSEEVARAGEPPVKPVAKPAVKPAAAAVRETGTPQ